MGWREGRTVGAMHLPQGATPDPHPPATLPPPPQHTRSMPPRSPTVPTLGKGLHTNPRQCGGLVNGGPGVTLGKAHRHNNSSHDYHAPRIIRSSATCCRQKPLAVGSALAGKLPNRHVAKWVHCCDSFTVNLGRPASSYVQLPAGFPGTLLRLPSHGSLPDHSGTLTQPCRPSDKTKPAIVSTLWMSAHCWRLPASASRGSKHRVGKHGACRSQKASAQVPVAPKQKVVTQYDSSIMLRPQALSASATLST